ncbi:MAG: transporter substrate-binding domain-containing protein [Arcobacter sp.]|uniref:ABC transporter substrate-binding protein n=1 Tax=Arcobacter sp. TaxID=1872629 RepID=UPI003D0892D7
MKNQNKLIIRIFLLSFILSQTLFANLEKVSLQLEWKHQFEFAGFYTAIEKGYYNDVGLEVEIKEFEDGINITEDVINGKSTFGISSSALILERLKGKPVVLVASYFKQNALALVTKPEIKTPADLKNKKIMALKSEMEQTSLGVMLKDYGIDENSYTLINHDFKTDKFINGEIDAMSIFITSQLFELDKLGIKYNVLNPANFGIYSYDVELFTSEEMINKYPKKVRDFVNATNKGWEYAFKNKQEIIDLIYEKYSKRKSKEALLFEANQTEQLFKTNIFRIGAITPELIKLNAEIFSKLGLVDRNFDINKISEEYYFDPNTKIKNLLTIEEKNYLENKHIIKVHNEANWAPINYNINNTPKGFSIDYMNLIASKIGISVEYISGFTWKEYLEKLKNNEIDVMLNIAKTNERENHFSFTSPYIHSVDIVYVREGTNNLKKLSDFNGKKMAVIRGFYEEELLKQKYPNIKLLSVENSLAGLKKVAFGEADGFIDDFAVANYFITNNLISNLKPAFEVKDEEFNLDLAMATNKENEILRNILEKGKDLITEEELLNLKKKWIKSNQDKIASKIPFTKEEEKYLKNKKVITMCVDPDWEPFERLDNNNKHIGIAADLIRLISSKLGVEIEVIPTKNWDESIIFSKEKKCDILSFLNETPKRKEWLNFTKPIFEDPNVIVTRNEFETPKDLSFLENRTIAIPSNTAMYELFEKDFPNLKIVPVETEAEAFSLVENKKVDMTVRSLIIAAYTIKKENLFNLKIVAQPLKYKNVLRIGVLKEDIILKDILNKAINEISKKEQEQIINNHVSIKLPDNSEYLSLIIYVLIFISLIIIIILLWNYQLRKKIAIEIEKNSIQQDLMFQQNKKAELGNLIGNISHQWRDSLTKIGYINLNLRAMLLQNKDVPRDFLDKSTLEIEKSLDFMSETMQNFLDYYKPSVNVLEFEVYDSIKSALSIIDTKIKNNNLHIEFKGDFDIKIKGIRNEWMQVWINLIINSINISIKRGIQNPIIEIKLSKDSIIFEDNCGKIDEALFIEINQEKYKGLGIKMSKEIAKKNNKNMIITNGEKGAIFKFIENK